VIHVNKDDEDDSETAKIDSSDDDDAAADSVDDNIVSKSSNNNEDALDINNSNNNDDYFEQIKIQLRLGTSDMDDYYTTSMWYPAFLVVYPRFGRNGDKHKKRILSVVT
jgi:hypothetical protein